MGKPNSVSRRGFLKGLGVGALGAATSCSLGRIELSRSWPGISRPDQTVLPRWRGFNLIDMLYPVGDNLCREDDFRWMRDWGFDFARVAVGYHIWHGMENPGQPKESDLVKVDRAVELGQRYGIHINLAFFGPNGYYQPKEKEAFLFFWKTPNLLDAFYRSWPVFAKRYKGRASRQLSFNLINEPPRPSQRLMTLEEHDAVVRKTVALIREIDPERLIVSDGIEVARAPRPDMRDLGVAQSCHCYLPSGLSHHQAEWIQPPRLETPTWPMQDGDKYWDRIALEAFFQPWADLARQGVGVHCGETGSFNKTPHGVALAWLRDVLDILKGHNIGYALWNFRGDFGILDSRRQDIQYEDFHGHKLDRKLLSLLQSF